MPAVVPDKPPLAGGFQVYVFAPTAVKVLLAPIQIAAGLGVTVKVGFGFTVNVTVFAMLVHEPTVLVTVYTNAVTTVLVAVTLGVAVAAPPVILPPAGAVQE